MSKKMTKAEVVESMTRTHTTSGKLDADPDPVIDTQEDMIMDELDMNIDIGPDTLNMPESTPEELAAFKASPEYLATLAPVKVEEVPQTPETKAVAVNIAALLKKLPDVVTPKNLDELFGYDDGGKTVRRTLRAKFTQASAHEHKKGWSWNKNDPTLTAILAHFAQVRKTTTAAAK